MKKYFAGVAAIALAASASSASAQLVGPIDPNTGSVGNGGQCPSTGCGPGPVIIPPVDPQDPGNTNTNTNTNNNTNTNTNTNNNTNTNTNTNTNNNTSGSWSNATGGTGVGYGGSVSGSGNSSSSSTGGSVSGSGNSTVGNNGNTLNGGSTTVSFNNRQVRQAPAAIPTVSADGSVAALAISTPFGGVAIPISMQRPQAIGYAKTQMYVATQLPCRAATKVLNSASRTGSRANKYIDEISLTEDDMCEPAPVGQADGVREFTVVTPSPVGGASPGPLPIVPSQTVAPCPVGTTSVSTPNGPACAPG